MEWNSYDRFFSWLSESKKNNDIREMRAEFWKFGIENIMFAHPDLAKMQFIGELPSRSNEFDCIYNVLCDTSSDNNKMILRLRKHNGKNFLGWSIRENKAIYLRKQKGYIKQKPIYEELYKKLFPSISMSRYKYQDNNPVRNSIRSFVDEEDKNFQCSHVFERSLNPMPYMALWNFALTPKMFDPLTGHETEGVDNIIFQILFQGVVIRLQKECIDKYNDFIKEKDSEVKCFIEKVKDKRLKNQIRKQFKEIKEVEYTHEIDEEKNGNSIERRKILNKFYSEELSKKIVDYSEESIEKAYKFVCEEILHVLPDFTILGKDYELPTDDEQKKWLEAHGDIVMIKFNGE